MLLLAPQGVHSSSGPKLPVVVVTNQNFEDERHGLLCVDATVWPKGITALTGGAVTVVAVLLQYNTNLWKK